MKKLTVAFSIVLFFMVFSCSSLFAIIPSTVIFSSEIEQAPPQNGNKVATSSINLSATGYASTVAEAQDKALEKLMELVFGTSASTVTKTKVKEDSKGNAEASFSNSFNSITSGSLIGVHYTTAQKSIDGKSYEITAYIDGSSLSLYEKELSSLSDEIYKEYNKKTSDLEEKKNQLISLLSLVSKFTSYRQVVIYLGETTNVPELPISETYRSLSEQLESVYTQMMNSEEQKKQNVSSYADLSVIETQINQLRAEQQALMSASTQLQVEQQRMYEQSLRDSIKQMIENSVKETSSMATGYSLEDDIEAAVQAIEKYNAMTSNLEAMLQSVRSKNSKELEIGIKSINSKEYRLAELSNGEPTAFALDMRNKEVLEFTNQKKTELTEQENLIIDGYKEEIQRLYDAMVENCLTIEERTYTLSSSNGDFTWYSKGFDGATSSWNLILGKYTDYAAYSLSYKVLTGNNPENGQSRLEYQNYLNSVDEYDNNLSNLVSFIIELSVIFDAKNGTVQYVISDIEICLPNKEKSSINISSEGSSESIGVKVQNIDYSWLKTDKSFNVLADAANEKKAQIIEQQKKEEAQEQKKSQALEDIFESLFLFYGRSKGRFIRVSEFRAAVGGTKINGNELYMEYDFGVTLGYALSKKIVVGIEPFAGLIVFGSSTSSNSSSNSKSTFFTFGALVSGEFLITNSVSVGVRGGFSIKGAMVNAYAKYSKGFLGEVGVAYYSLGNIIAVTCGVAYAF